MKALKGICNIVVLLLFIITISILGSASGEWTSDEEVQEYYDPENGYYVDLWLKSAWEDYSGNEEISETIKPILRGLTFSGVTNDLMSIYTTKKKKIKI